MWKVGSLFSGIGGIEYGFEKTGKFETKWFVEREPYAQAVLRKHWPSAKIFEDVRSIDFRTCEKVEVLTGGFPCQDISNAGKRKGITGERSGLWKEYLRAISEIRPKIAFIENVSALRARGLDVVLADLASIWYDAEWHCLPASAIGAPHRRDRIFIMAYANNSGHVHGQDEIQPTEIRQQVFSESKSSGNEELANSNFKRLEGKYESRYSGRQSEEALECGSEDLPNANLKRRDRSGFKESKSKDNEEWNLQDLSKEWREREPKPFSMGSRERIEESREKNRRTTWATDAGVLRVANGIPNRVHRIKGIGNAVVPQVAEYWAEIIAEKLDEAARQRGDEK